MHVILIAAGPVDAALETVLVEDAVHVAAHGNRIGVGAGAEIAAGQGLAGGVAVVVLVGVDVDGQADAVLRFPGPAIAA